MPKKPNISTLVGGWASTSRLNTIFQQILNAFDNTLSRDGSSPNQMNADIDMNGNDLINVGAVSTSELTVGGDSLVSLVNSAAEDSAAAAASAASAASSAGVAVASAATAEEIENNLPVRWRGTWATSTFYLVGDLVTENGSTYRCVVEHTSTTFSTDFGNSYWANFALKGAPGDGTGDMVGANNLSDLASPSASLVNLGLTATASELNTLDGITGKTGGTFGGDKMVTGIAGTSGQVAWWNAFGNLVGVGIITQTSSDWEAGTSTDVSLVSPEQVAAAVSAQASPVWQESSVVETNTGTVFDFTSLPAGITEIELWLDQVSLSGTDDLVVRLSVGGAFAESQYRATSWGVGLFGGPLTASTYFPIRGNSSGSLLSGSMCLHRFETRPGGDTWTMTSTVGGEYPHPRVSSGRVLLSGVVDGLRLTRSGTNSFDSGKIKLRYR